MFSFSRQVSIECTSETNKFFRDSLSVYENVTTHEGDLTINGTETYLIGNCTYIQNGNVYVRDQANLEITNSVLRVSQHYNYQYEFVVGDAATLEMKNSSLDGTYGGLFLFFRGTSRGIINSSSLNRTSIWVFDESDVSIGYSTLLEAGAGDSSQMLIVSSEFIWATNLCFDGDDAVSLDGLTPGYCNYWNLHANVNVTNVSWDFTLMDTYVVAWSIFLQYDTIAFVSNSEIERVSLEFYNRDIRIEGVKPGIYENWRLHNIAFMNVTVTGTWNLDLRFSDEASCIVANSDAWLTVGAGSGNIYVQDSYVCVTAFPQFVGKLVFNNSTFTISGLGLLRSDFFVEGNVSVDEPPWEWPWVSTNVTRNYNMMAKGMSGNPIENAELTLFDKNSTLIWNGTTNSLGQANFDLTFTDNNYTNTLRLEAVKGNLSGVQNVTFLSDTPVIVELGLHDDAIASVVPLKTVVGQGFLVHVNVALVNRGNFTETFNVTVYANGTQVETEPVTLKNSTSTNMVLTLNTTGLAYGNYTISAVADAVPNEADTTNNNCTCNVAVHVGVPGDISGPTLGVYDGKCDLRDVSYLIIRFNSRPNSANWNPNVDINNDGTVNMRDVQIPVLNFNKHE
jgi:hypothetical protein